MGLPYNPSSFATNKTILQAIEELKNYLKDNPCYKVYYVNTPYVVGTYTYNLSDVDDPDDTMTEYDVVFFTNSYYAKVIVKDTNTFDIDPAVDFRGATGATGANGVSVSGASIDGNGHLILTMSDGSTIDAGEMPSTYNHYVQLSSGTSGYLTSDEVAKLRYPDSVIIRGTYPTLYEVYHKIDLGIAGVINFALIKSNAYGTTYIRIQVSNSSPYNWDVFNQSSGLTVQSGQIYYGGSTAGKVLTSNASNGASWEDIPSATYGNTVSITATSGTFSDSDFAKLGYGDSTIVYTDSYSVSTVYKLKLETASILEFEAIDAASRTNLKLIDVNKSTKAYSMTAISMITSSTISSGTATSGKVLTANGSGGCSWETAGGGGSQLYEHNITINNSTLTTAPRARINIKIVNSSSTPINSFTSINTYLDSIRTANSNVKICCSGTIESGANTEIFYSVSGATTYGSGIVIQYSSGTSLITEFSMYGSSSNYTLNDAVLTL